jgi:threonine aldolase
MKTIDLRSDTVTKPTDEMRQAMLHAEVGDDVYGEDPTVNQLEQLAAQKCGKEAALFVSSGTMGNLVALLVHCQRGHEAIVGRSSHIALWEQGGAATLGGITLRMVPNNPDGTLDTDAVLKSIQPDDVHCARTKLICVENTWNGNPLPLSHMKAVAQIARDHHLKLHVDGARLFNATVALNVDLAKLVEDADSVQMCLSKGLSAPAGSVICSSRKFIDEARRMRKLLGGGMRQVGVLAASCIVALEKMIPRLKEDHEHAALLAELLESVQELEVVRPAVRTNMVFFSVKLPGMTSAEFAIRMKGKHLLMGVEGTMGIRAVTHDGITRSDVEEAAARIKALAAELVPATTGESR